MIRAWQAHPIQISLQPVFCDHIGGIDALGLEVAVDLLEELLPQVVLLEEMAKLQDGRFIRHRLPAEIDADEGAQGLGIVQCLFRSRIGEVEPLARGNRCAAYVPSPLEACCSRS